MFKPLQWGQTRKILANQWQKDLLFTVVERTAEYSGDAIHVEGVKNPFVKNLTLGVSNPNSELIGTFALRWKIAFGVGGGEESFFVDANDLQQMSLSADQLRVSIASTYVGIVDGKNQPLGIPFNYSNPTRDFDVSAFYAEGMTSTDPPTLTQQFKLDTAGAPSGLDTVLVPIPKFVSTFRLLGNPALPTSPFTANQTYEIISPASTILDGYTGDKIFDVRLAPIPTGLGSFLFIQNNDGANQTTGSIEWGLDL